MSTVTPSTVTPSAVTPPARPATAAGPSGAARRNSELVRAKIGLLMPGFSALTSRLWTSPSVAELYPRYLRLLHTAIRATVPLMDLALERSEALAPTDPVAAGLVGYLTKHRREERGHDDWVREDLAAIGRDPDTLLSAMPGTAVANLVGAQYYWIRHHHPVCLLGHIAVLEGYPPSPQLTGYLRERTGYPAEGFRTLHRHATLDVRHRDELLRFLDELPLQPEHHTAIGVSALHTLQATTVLFEELLATAPEAPPAPVAGPGPAARPV
ncbi:iron-containing redox enzyme family protein [Kitasatospora indigofera]|uniref:iron-containing redox enzyme family protein n=1 Tax=Kitasatospora indigofera TaxID=67307 RepID=UPI0036955813